MTEIYFWCFSSSEQYFLCLIKYVFWLAPFVFIILILTQERWACLEPQSNVMRKGSRLKSLISVCLNNVDHQTGCGRAPLEDSQSSQFLVLLDLTLIPMVCSRKTPLCVPFIPLYKEPCHVRTEKADVPTAPGGFDRPPL